MFRVKIRSTSVFESQQFGNSGKEILFLEIFCDKFSAKDCKQISLS